MPYLYAYPLIQGQRAGIIHDCVHELGTDASIHACEAPSSQYLPVVHLLLIADGLEPHSDGQDRVGEEGCARFAQGANQEKG